MSHPLTEALPAIRFTRPQTRLADEVSHVLRDLILRGDLAPGTPLLQVQLAERLGVSRTPLREAFRILERDGLLRISNGNKTVEVIELSRQHLLETYQVREVIDGLAARLAAAKGVSGRAADRMTQAIDRMETASRTSLDVTEYGEGHVDFHLAVLEESDNSRLEDFSQLTRFSAHMLLTRYLQQTYGTDAQDIVQRSIRAGNADHRAIYEAIRAGDAKGAEGAASRHIRKTIRFVESIPDSQDTRDARKNSA